MPERSDWSVPWPDGSWLTWNEATESWEKQDAPPATTSEAAQEPASSTKLPAEKTPAKKTPVKKTVPGNGDAKKTSAPKTTSKKTTAAEKASKAPPPNEERAVTQAPKATASKDGASATTATPAEPPSNATPAEQRWSWQPMAGAEGRSTTRQKVTPLAERPARTERSTVGRSQESLLPLVAGGVGVGVVAGYFLVNLIR